MELGGIERFYPLDKNWGASAFSTEFRVIAKL